MPLQIVGDLGGDACDEEAAGVNSATHLTNEGG